MLWYQINLSEKLKRCVFMFYFVHPNRVGRELKAHWPLYEGQVYDKEVEATVAEGGRLCVA